MSRTQQVGLAHPVCFNSLGSSAKGNRSGGGDAFLEGVESKSTRQSHKLSACSNALFSPALILSWVTVERFNSGVSFEIVPLGEMTPQREELEPRHTLRTCPVLVPWRLHSVRSLRGLQTYRRARMRNKDLRRQRRQKSDPVAPGGTLMDAGNGKSRDFRLSEALLTRWFKRVRAATLIFATFRPLFRLGGRWSASIPSDARRRSPP